jgi:hypothetical protein
MVDLMQKETTITSEVCCKTPKEKLCKAIQNKKAWNADIWVVFLHDNYGPHTAAHTRALLEHFNWELFDHHLTALILLQETTTCLPI